MKQKKQQFFPSKLKSIGVAPMTFALTIDKITSKGDRCDS